MKHYSHTQVHRYSRPPMWTTTVTFQYTVFPQFSCGVLQSYSSTQSFHTSHVELYSHIPTPPLLSNTVTLDYTEFPNHPYGLLQSHMSKQSFNISHVEHYTHIYTEFPHLQCGALQSHYSTQRFHTFHVEHYTHSPVYRFSTAPKWSSPATLKYSVFLTFDMEH